KDPVLPYEKVVAWGNAHGYPAPPTEQSDCTSQATPEGTATEELGTDVHIESPHDNDVVNGILKVVGTASVPNFRNYILEIGQNNQWAEFASGSAPVTSRSELGRLDTRQIPEGPYLIRLTAFDQSGGVMQH